MWPKTLLFLLVISGVLAGDYKLQCQSTGFLNTNETLDNISRFCKRASNITITPPIEFVKGQRAKNAVGLFAKFIPPQSKQPVWIIVTISNNSMGNFNLLLGACINEFKLLLAECKSQPGVLEDSHVVYQLSVAATYPIDELWPSDLGDFDCLNSTTSKGCLCAYKGYPTVYSQFDLLDNRCPTSMAFLMSKKLGSIDRLSGHKAVMLRDPEPTGCKKTCQDDFDHCLTIRSMERCEPTQQTCSYWCETHGVPYRIRDSRR